MASVDDASAGDGSVLDASEDATTDDGKISGGALCAAGSSRDMPSLLAVLAATLVLARRRKR